MDVQPDTASRPLERADVDTMLDQLSAARMPSEQEMRSLAGYAFVYQPHGAVDFARSSICEYFQENLARFEPRLRYNVMKLVMDRLQQDLVQADYDYNLTPPTAIGEAVGLVFRSGDADALERLYAWTTGRIAMPRSFYNTFAHEFSLVSSWVDKIPKTDEFTATLLAGGQDAWRVVNVQLKNCDSAGDENDSETNWGNAAGIGSVMSAYGKTPDRSPQEKWRAECLYSNLSKKTACQKFVDICTACGVSAEPPERQPGFFENLFFGRRTNTAA